MDDFDLPNYDAAVSVEENTFLGSINRGFETDFGATKQQFVSELPESRPEIVLPSVDALTEEIIRSACVEYAQDSCCYGYKFIRDMIITNMTNSYAFKYKLESYGEKRETVERYSPYYGQIMDGAENGPEPDHWAVKVPVQKEFQDGQTKVEIPHTAHVKKCDNCEGNRRVHCDSCYGNGSYPCFQCHGRGKDIDDDGCPICSGSGKRKCLICNGTGLVECRVCDGYGRLKHYKLLIVTRKRHEEEFLSNTMSLPKECILALCGRKIFTDQNTEVLPLSHAPDSLVNEASRKLVNKHLNAFPDELVIQQRHTLRAIPLTRVTYQWQSKEGEFYVYGFKNKVYFEQYPEKCCCTCI